MIRRPRVQDVPAMVAIINARAATGEILPRSLNHVYQNLRDFLLAECDGRVVACGAMHVLWADLGEIRAVAADPAAPAGSDSQVVRALLAEARRIGLPRVFAFTYRPEFFLDLGFTQVERESLPRIVWRECIDCVKFPACDETAVCIDLSAESCT